MKHAYPIGRGTSGYPSLVGNLSGFSPLREAQAAPEPTYRVKATQPIEELFRLSEAVVEIGDFTDANLDLD